MYSFKTGVSNRVNFNAVLWILPAVCLLFLAAGTAQAQRTAATVCAALYMSSENCARITNISTIPHSDLVLAAALGLGDVSIPVAAPICAALNTGSEDCARITSISTIPHTALVLPAALGLGDVSIAVAAPWLISTAAAEGGTSLCSGAVGHSQTRCLVPGATLPAVPQSVFHCVPMARRDWIARLSQQTTGYWKIVLRHWDGATLRDWESMESENGIRIIVV